MMLLAHNTRTSRLLVNGASGATTPAAKPEPSAAALRETMAKLEEHFASRSLFRRFVSTHSSRGSQTVEACSSLSFLSATAGIIKWASQYACPPHAPSLTHCAFSDSKHLFQENQCLLAGLGDVSCIGMEKTCLGTRL